MFSIRTRRRSGRCSSCAGASSPGATCRSSEGIVTLAIVGYADRMSVRPGATLKVMVSCETGAASYRAELVRLICGDDSPNGPGYKERPVEHPANGTYPGRRQRIHAGSYI